MVSSTANGSSGLIPEPEDSGIHGDFIVWEGLIEGLKSVENRLKRTLIKVSDAT